MKYAYSIFISIFLFSCSTLEYGLMIDGNAQEILDQLNDLELKKGKVFVFSNKQDGLWQFVRVNDEEKHMRDQEVQVFDLVANFVSLLLLFSQIIIVFFFESFFFTKLILVSVSRVSPDFDTNM